MHIAYIYYEHGDELIHLNLVSDQLLYPALLASMIEEPFPRVRIIYIFEESVSNTKIHNRTYLSYFPVCLEGSNCAHCTMISDWITTS